MIKKNLSSQCYDIMKNKILIEREYAPNERIYADKLAKELEISRTPIREALLKLEKEGIVVIEPNKGIYVKKRLLEEILEIYDIRIALEQILVEKAISNITSKDIKLLKENCRNFEKKFEQNKFNVCQELDNKFHDIISSASNTILINDIIHEYGIQTRAIAVRGDNYDSMGRTYLQQHKKIIKYLGKRDLKKAKSAMKEHIETGKNVLLQDPKKYGLTSSN